MKIKPKSDFYLTAARMVIIKSQEIKVGKDMENREHFYTVDGNVTVIAIMENNMAAPQKIKKLNYCMAQPF